MDVRLAFSLTRALMDQHGLTDWQLGADQAKRRAGRCNLGQQVITISVPLARLYDEPMVRETALHEIAHALAGAAHNHDDVWRALALSIGSSGERCIPEDAPSIDGSWHGSCPAGHTQTALRRPVRVRCCGQCTRSFSVDHLVAWTWVGSVVRMHPAYVAELVQIRAQYGASAGLTEQLEADVLVGGGEQHAAVQARLSPILPPGSAVRLKKLGGRADVAATVLSFEKTRYKVRVGTETYWATPGALVLSSDQSAPTEETHV